VTATALVSASGDETAIAACRDVASTLAAAGWQVHPAPLATDTGPLADLVLCADTAAAGLLAADPACAGRLGLVVTAAPADLARDAALLLPVDVVEASRSILCADETIRGLVDVLVPGAAGRAVVVGGRAGSGADGAARLGARVRPPDGGLSAVHGRPLRVVVAGHALHFLTAVTEHLSAAPDVELRIDHVRSFARQDEQHSAELLRWADVVFCEWAGPVAIWYSRRKRPGQRLLVRLHRYELYREWPAEIDIAAVDQVVCVSPHYARLTRELTGWAPAKVAVVPNYVDAELFDRPKLPGAEFTLGFLGMTPRRKRVDLALDVLERLRRRDPRYNLTIKTKFPWDDSWNRAEGEEMSYARDVVRRVAATPDLASSVAFEPYGADVAAWMRGVGFVLSTSDDESFHLSPAEGMASGAVPALLPWPGSETVYDRRWIDTDVDAMADRIDETVRSGSWAEVAALARGQIRASFDVPVVVAAIRRLLVEDLPVEPADATLAAPIPGVVPDLASWSVAAPIG